MAEKIQLRILVFFPLIGILASITGGFFCGILFGVHDMPAGFYPGCDRFISNMFNRGIETGIAGVLIALISFALFTISAILCAFGLLEVLRHKHLKENN